MLCSEWAVRLESRTGFVRAVGSNLLMGRKTFYSDAHVEQFCFRLRSSEKELSVGLSVPLHWPFFYSQIKILIQMPAMILVILFICGTPGERRFAPSYK